MMPRQVQGVAAAVAAAIVENTDLLPDLICLTTCDGRTVKVKTQISRENISDSSIYCANLHIRLMADLSRVFPHLQDSFFPSQM